MPARKGAHQTGSLSSTSQSWYVCADECAERPVMEAPNAGGTDCSEPGIELSTLPVMPGYWRESREARIVRRCPGQANCLGGAGDASCANGSTGILCSTCWFLSFALQLENHTGSLPYKAYRWYKLGERKPSVPCAPCAEVDYKRLQYSLLSATT
mgnify:CR=1 FL=1